MRTESQLQASRANGAKSRGPATPAGKINSSQNATRHGVFAKSILLKRESKPHFDEFAQSLRDEFQPQTAFEHTLVDNMIIARWRSARFALMEQALLDHEIDKTEKKIAEGLMGDDAALEHSTTAALSFRDLADDGHALELLNRYQGRCDRQYLRDHRRLMEVQDRRRNTPPPARTGPVLIPIRPAPEQEMQERTRQPIENNELTAVTDIRIFCTADDRFSSSAPSACLTEGVHDNIGANLCSSIAPKANSAPTPPPMAAE